MVDLGLIKLGKIFANFEEFKRAAFPVTVKFHIFMVLTLQRLVSVCWRVSRYSLQRVRMVLWFRVFGYYQS
jgi:hypothetical protein